MHICAVAAACISWSIDASAQGYADYITKAKEGDAVSQYAIGLCYENGKGVYVNYGMAAEWYEKAAAQDLHNAQYRLGLLYYNGKGVEQNHMEAESLFRKAAEQDNVGAQYYVGVCCFEKGAYEEAHTWLTKAAEQNIPEAQYLLALLYEEGAGTVQNYSEAFRWYHNAALNGMAKAQYYTGLYYVKGKGTEASSADAIIWFRKAAEQNHPAAQHYLATLLASVEDNYTEALEWWEKAGKQGVYEASFMAAVCYEKGYGTDINILQAMVWYLKADEQGHPGAKVKYDELLITVSDVL